MNTRALTPITLPAILFAASITPILVLLIRR